jgi:hypothetical protein
VSRDGRSYQAKGRYRGFKRRRQQQAGQQAQRFQDQPDWREQAADHHLRGAKAKPTPQDADTEDLEERLQAIRERLEERP